MRMERPPGRRGSRVRRSGAFGVLLYRVDVDGEYACAVVGEERGERAAYHFGSYDKVLGIKVMGFGWDSPVDHGYGAAVGAIAVG